MIFTLYDIETGAFTGRTVECAESQVAHCLPPGMAAIPGKHDYRSRRVDLATKRVEPFKPPQPSDEHVWSGSAELWELTAEAQAAQAESIRAKHLINNAELGSLRVMREALLEILPAQSPTLVRLQALDNAIAEQRHKVKK